jgi:sterol 3beta-glucosyltransferase
VVASNGTGPSPIPIAQLSTESLASAIEVCLTPSAKAAAQNISSQMRRENGVEAAVASFHRHLPVDAMTCDLLPANAARWEFHPKSRGGGARAIKLSQMAVYKF